MTMVRLLDARHGSLAEIRPAVPGVLRVCAHLPERDQADDISDLRLLLVADLLVRTAEVSNLQALVALESAEQTASHAEALAYLVSALGIHPPAAQVRCRDAAAALGGPIDVHLVSGGADATDDRDGLYASVGAARIYGAGNEAGDTARADVAVVGDAGDVRDVGDLGEIRDVGEAADAGDVGEEPARRYPEPLAIRLALMSSPYPQPVEITRDALAGAAETLEEWRVAVARWAELPSKRVPPHVADQVRSAFRDLDTVSALSLLRTLAADTGMAEGAKFETFAYVDRLLGLEFAKRVGQL
jgi:hypothetical protein